MFLPRRALLGLLFGLVAAGVCVYFLLSRGPDERDLDGPLLTGGFKDVAREAGLKFRMAFLPNEQGENFKINLYDHGCGVAAADFDGDGYDDIYFLNQLGTNALYRNNGDGTFTDVTEKAGVGLGDRICVGAVFADFDNDGFPDLYVTSTRGGNVLFKNMGDGTFKDITKVAGVEVVAHCQTATFFDYDNDGLLDLLVTCTAKWTAGWFDKESHYYPGRANVWEMAKSPIEYNVLYHNNGDGTFTDVTAQAGLKGKGWGGDVAVFDYDGDGRLDLLVTNMFGASQLYRNTGKGSFKDVTEKTLGRTSWGAIGCKAFDYNNDGKLDLLIVDMHSDMWALPDTDPTFLRANQNVRYDKISGANARLDRNGTKREEKFAQTFQVQYDKTVFGNTLFKNLGQGEFKEVALQAGIETWWPWGIATGDFDNDGFEDVFIPSGMGYPFPYWPNQLMMNNGNETFTERAEGMEPPRFGRFLDERIGGKPAARSSRCAATADFRNIGRLDIVTNNFNDQPYYFQNQFPKKNYVQFRLQGAKTKGDAKGTKKSNRDAVGALVHLHIGKEILTRQVQAAGGYLSQSSNTLHFGLGERTNINRVDIRWPSGILQTIPNPDINKLHKILEPAS